MGDSKSCPPTCELRNNDYCPSSNCQLKPKPVQSKPADSKPCAAGLTMKCKVGFCNYFVDCPHRLRPTYEDALAAEIATMPDAEFKANCENLKEMCKPRIINGRYPVDETPVSDKPDIENCNDCYKQGVVDGRNSGLDAAIAAVENLMENNTSIQGKLSGLHFIAAISVLKKGGRNGT